MDKVDSWRSSASMATLKERAKLIKKIRQFFDERGFLEVDTPVMGQYGVTDVHLSNIPAYFRGQSYQLQTSPEYHMKRLLASGSGPIYQMIHAFRDDELGRWHNPEFTMLEWYQLDIDHHGLMDEVEALLALALDASPMRRVTYQALFFDLLGIDPFDVDVITLKSLLKSYELHGVLKEGETDISQYLFLLLSHIIEPIIATERTPVAVYNFPASQAALAKINSNGEAERFEVYYQGVELANGFHELTDAKEQRARFEQDRQLREDSGHAAPNIDPRFIAALEYGLPPCSGVALGIERLLALRLGKESISEVFAFDFQNA